ncbi:hypothetical protein FPV67DRAFT_760949 [Lyophyllum atratum]|nr:hypothetical protein FPV67DRAFT_760949 [Lyophyllum atratum]
MAYPCYCDVGSFRGCSMGGSDDDRTFDSCPLDLAGNPSNIPGQGWPVQSSIPTAAGDKMHGTIVREGKHIMTLNPNKFAFQGNPKSYIFNAFVASASTK